MTIKPWITLFFCGAIALPRLARAEGPDDGQRAQTSFEEGKALFEAENFAAACPKLAESLELAPGIGVTLYLASCEDNIGKKASALGHYRDAETMAHARGDAREGVAHGYVVKLEAETTRIRVHLPAGSSAQKITVTDNGHQVAANSRGFAVDPGPHRIHASSSNGAEWSDVVHVPDTAAGVDGGTFDVTVPQLDRGAAPIPERGKDAPILGREKDAPSERPTSTFPVQKAIAIGVGAAGVIGIGVGSFLGLHAKSLQDESNGAGGGCNAADACDSHGQQLRMSALDSATASTVLFAVGGAAIVTGVVLFITAPSSHRDVSVAFGPTNASLTGRF